MIKCYVVDDELHAIETLAEYIQLDQNLQLIGTETKPEKAVDFIIEHQPDVTFLDIEMAGMNGMEVAELVRHKTRVIFTTAYPNFALEAFDKDAFDYLLKPVSLSRFKKAIIRVGEKSLSLSNPPVTTIENDFIYINPGIRGKMVRINLSDISYIEGLKNYVLVFSGEEKFITYLTMTEICNALPSSKFMRVQKSFIINLDKIKSIDGHNVTLAGGKVVTLGGTYKEALIEHVSSKSLRSGRK